MPKEIVTKNGNAGVVLALVKKESTSRRTGEVYEQFVGTIEHGGKALTIVVKSGIRVLEQGKYSGQEFLSCTVIQTAKRSMNYQGGQGGFNRPPQRPKFG